MLYKFIINIFHFRLLVHNELYTIIEFLQQLIINQNNQSPNNF